MEVELPWIPTDSCNDMFDTDKRTEWIKITDQNLCFGKSEGGIDACQVKENEKCFVCQVGLTRYTWILTMNNHEYPMINR